MKKVSIVASLLFLSAVCIGNAHAATLDSQRVAVKTPEVRLYRVGGHSAEAFMELQNNSKRPISIIAATSSVDHETQLHKTVVEHGKVTMVQIKQIELPAKKDEDLKFGGVHIMLMNLKQPLQVNSPVSITLVFADGSNLKVNAKVVN